MDADWNPTKSKKDLNGDTLTLSLSCFDCTESKSREMQAWKDYEAKPNLQSAIALSSMGQ